MQLKSSNHLVIFTRYPEAGTTKTRLIPALGAEQAARLQRQMTEHMITQTRSFRSSQELSVEVQFSGGTASQMRDWLGKGLHYQKQPDGDLGYRLIRAFYRGFRSGAERVVIIGSDCPELRAKHLTQAYERLQNQDLVLGPAQDGGYYLIGMTQTHRALFHNIDWGTERVFRQTVAIAKHHHLSLSYLETLQDVDRPEDLGILHRIPLHA